MFTSKNKDKTQRWAWMADTHSGSPVGLTPYPNNPIQRELYLKYEDAIKWFGEAPDVVVAVGDITEGVDPKLDVEDMKIVSQFEKSAELLAKWKAKKEYILVRGTRVHVSVQFQELEEIATAIIKNKCQEKYGIIPKVTIHSKLKTTINNWFLVEARHFIGASVIPHGRSTAPMRSQMWNILNAALKSYEDEAPVHWPQLLVFAHTHYYNYTDNAWGATMILPAWKALGDKFGDEICDGHVDLGIVKTIIEGEDTKKWTKDVRLYNAGVVSRTEHR
jgi:hypothetical protein